MRYSNEKLSRKIFEYVNLCEKVLKEDFDIEERIKSCSKMIVKKIPGLIVVSPEPFWIYGKGMENILIHNCQTELPKIKLVNDNSIEIQFSMGCISIYINNFPFCHTSSFPNKYVIIDTYPVILYDKNQTLNLIPLLMMIIENDIKKLKSMMKR